MEESNTAALVTTVNDFDKTGSTAQHETERNSMSNQAGGEAMSPAREKEPEVALETHEVVEINKFTERKEWIEEKIKLLESMPPIEVFAGVDTLISLSEELPPGLPTRAQLDHWLEEHDKTEKETEIFDAEDMSKLKKLTKAATQRNLSPEDTDLIELTLTTLLALDRLLHLLRDRSESLDLLSLRLTWEEQRVTAWKERRSLLDDLKVFLVTRARWSLDTYELQPPFTPSPSQTFRMNSPSPSPRPSTSDTKRRDSAASFTSISSDTSTPTTGPSAVFSRSTRYKLVESLSHDAALFSSRLTALNHSKVKAAGKTLDKLIDASRKPVPDEILDEQDRLEDKAVKEIESIGKFAMTAVMQWKRADEHYNDTMKDQFAAQALLNELDHAKHQHPTLRHDAAFTSRAQALTKRLAVKGDPLLPRSSFPRPSHPLFPDQIACNEGIAKALSAELAEAVKAARQAEAAAHEYHFQLEAIRRAEGLRDEMQRFIDQLDQLASKLLKGLQDGYEHGDTSSPDLNNEACLDPMRHATFLALLPSLAQEFDQADRSAERALRDATLTSLHLKALPGVNATLTEEVLITIQELEAKRDATRRIKENVLAKSHRLKEARRLWDALNDIMDNVEDVKKQAFDGMEVQRWKVPTSRRDGVPMTPDPDTPDPPHVVLPVTLTPQTLSQRLDALTRQLSTDLRGPLAELLPSLESPLSLHLQASLDGLVRHIDEVRGMIRLWDRLAKQADSMNTVRHEACEIEDKINILQANVDDARQGVLQDAQLQEETVTPETELTFRALALQQSVRSFTDTLAARIPLVSRAEGGSQNGYSTTNSTSNFPSSVDNLNRLKGSTGTTPLFDIHALDNDVRNEGNTLALRLTGGMRIVIKKLDYLRLSRLASVNDHTTEELLRELNRSNKDISELKASFETAQLNSKRTDVDSTLSKRLATLVDQVDQMAQSHCKRASDLPVRQSLQALQEAPGANDSPVHGSIIIPRVKATNHASHMANSITDAIVHLKVQITEAKSHEDLRLRIEQEQLDAEERARVERERLRTEKEREHEIRIQMEKLRPGEIHTETEQRATETANTLETLRSREGGHEKVIVQAAASPKAPDEDVFGHRLVPSLTSANPLPPHLADLRARVISLQIRLRSLSISSLIRPPTSHSGGSAMVLPSLKSALDAQSIFSTVALDMAALPAIVEEDITINSELQSLRTELEAARIMMRRLVHLGQVCDKVAACDHALSDLLEHADTYPAAPPTTYLASLHTSDVRLPCEEQLENRLAFTKAAMTEMDQACAAVADDLRVAMERTRLQQTWSELSDMCTDRINGTRSRPASSVSSTGNSIRQLDTSLAQRKPKPSLSGNGPRPKRKESLTPRVLPSVHESIGRSSAHSSNRSVSGPSGSSSIFNTTFASRQRTSSLASIHSASVSPFKRPTSPVSRPRPIPKRPGSPTFSETSGHSLTSTPSRSTWSRAPRQSFGTAPRNFQSHEAVTKRKAYIANPRSKLDIAVGNVINNFRLPVTVQAAGDGWRDQSGKYWIGDSEPKLCFCRILRSQTVMVRVGGGWCELSKFLRGHFADLLAELPPSPPRKEERWINASTVREAMATPIAVQGTTTPEPKGLGQLPSLQISTPNGASPQSLNTSSPPGDSSPGLTPFQFMRRADAGLRPVTPSPSKSSRMKPVTPGGVAVTPSRTNIWRP